METDGWYTSLPAPGHAVVTCGACIWGFQGIILPKVSFINGKIEGCGFPDALEVRAHGLAHRVVGRRRWNLMALL